MAILFMAWYITYVNVCSNASFSHFGLLITAIVECVDQNIVQELRVEYNKCYLWDWFLIQGDPYGNSQK